MIGRRTFLKVGLAGGVVLGAGGIWYAATREAVAPGRLDNATRSMFGAIAPVILAGVALPEPATTEDVVAGVEAAFGGLSAAAQKELGELFGLLSFTPTRFVLTGVSEWGRASHADIAGFLESWRRHRLALLRGAYAALHDLVLGAWYARTESWEAIGYPGPPEVK